MKKKKCPASKGVDTQQRELILGLHFDREPSENVFKKISLRQQLSAAPQSYFCVVKGKKKSQRKHQLFVRGELRMNDETRASS